jgi:NAD(P)H-flavin reductase
MQELINNGGKARDQHHMMRSTVIYETIYDNAIKVLKLAIPDGNISDFQNIGTFVFIRSKENTFYDVPISVLRDDIDDGSIELMIQLQGIKTECFRDLKAGDNVFLRGPYLNGILGLRALATTHDKDALILCRGLGFFPSLHAIKELQRNNNHVKIYVDAGTLNRSLLKAVKSLFELEINEISFYAPDGEVSGEAFELLDDALNHNIGFIHFGMSNYLIKRLVGYVESRNNKEVQLSCINNSHMCCGEGICGACTINTDSNKIVHMCKEQLNLYEYARQLV